MAVRDGGSGRIKLRGASNEQKVAEERRFSMRAGSRRVGVLGIVCAVIVVLALILPNYITQVWYQSLATWFSDVASGAGAMLNLFTGNGLSQTEVKFCGVITGALSGAALGMCGSAYQGAFNNNLAAPKTLGVMAGGALGSLLWVMLFQDSLSVALPSARAHTLATDKAVNEWLLANDPFGWLLSNYAEPLFSVAGCFLVVAFVVGVTKLVGHGRLSNIVVIVCGQVIAAAVTGVINYCRYVVTMGGNIDLADQLAEIENYVMVQDYYFSDLALVCIPMIVCIVILLLMRNRLTLLSFGDDEAQTMGVNVQRTRAIMIVLATIMTGWAISFCGHVAFLGFISAHIARKIVGPDFKFLLPASLLVGASLITVILYLCQSGFPGTDPNSAGTVCSIVGGCIFLVLALREGRRVRGVES